MRVTPVPVAAILFVTLTAAVLLSPAGAFWARGSSTAAPPVQISPLLSSSPAPPSVPPPGYSANLTPAPSPRDSPGMVYDARGGYFLLFGGQSTMGCGGTCTVPYNDTWTYGAGHWTRLNLSIAPSPRSQFGMVYDGLTGQVVLFGGIAPNGYNFGDMWSFYGGIWHNITATAGTPPARHQQVMVYGGRDHYILRFGGGHQARSA